VRAARSWVTHHHGRRGPPDEAVVAWSVTKYPTVSSKEDFWRNGAAGANDHRKRFIRTVHMLNEIARQRDVPSS
jgi:hypothetical protein